jgi:hypothetical protein
MPLRSLPIGPGSHPTGKDQGRIVVQYRDTKGRTRSAYVEGVAGMASPGAPTVTVQGTPGTTAYRYRVTAVDNDGTESVAGPAGTTATGPAALSGANFVRLSWAAVPDAVAYRVYGRTGADGTLTRLAQVSATTFDDTGAAGTGEALPAAAGAGNLKLRVRSGGYDNVLYNVPAATNRKQTNVYLYRR